MFNFNNIFESLKPDSKDLKRINDMVNKANGDELKEITLANKMVKSILLKDKMERRYTAAKEILGGDHNITKIFAKGCKEMGIDIEEHDNIDNLFDSGDIIDKIEDPTPTVKEIVDAVKEENDKNSNSYDLAIVDDHNMLKNEPLEYATQMVKLHKIFAKKFAEECDIDNIKDTIKNILLNLQSKNYSVLKVNNIKFDSLTGNFILNFVLGGFRYNYIETIDNYRIIKKLKNQYVWFNLSNVELSLLDNSLYINPNTFKTDFYTYNDTNNPNNLPDNYNKPLIYKAYRGDYILESIAKVISPSLAYINRRLNTELQKYTTIKDILADYNSFINKLYNNGDLYNGNINWSVQSQNSQRMKLYSKITNMICRKFDVSDEAYSDWPGFAINISPKENQIYFKPYYRNSFIRNYNVRTRKHHVSQITGLSEESEYQVLGRWLKKIFGRKNITDFNSCYCMDFDTFKEIMKK